MVVSSTLVNVSDDAEIRLVSLLTESAIVSSTFQADCLKAIDAGEAGPLLDTILNDSGAITALLSIPSEETAAAAASLLAALLERSHRPVSDVSNLIVNASNSENARKITLLSVLYNMRVDRKEKVDLLKHILVLATPDMLEPTATLGRLLQEPPNTSQPVLASLLDAWDVKDRHDLYQAVVGVLPVTDLRRQRFLLLLLMDAPPSDPTIQAAATQAAVGAIRDPISLFAQQRTMLSLPAVQGLELSSPVLFGLLKVFQEGKLADYRAFLAANGGENATLGPWGLDAESCTKSMRVLSLCSLASEHEEIPYSIIAETLDIPQNQVETWVIAAVSSGLLQAKMDQLAHQVMVERSVVRQFGPQQWKDLQRRLKMWKDNVGSVLHGLKASQIVKSTK